MRGRLLLLSGKGWEGYFVGGGMMGRRIRRDVGMRGGGDWVSRPLPGSTLSSELDPVRAMRVARVHTWQPALNTLMEARRRLLEPTETCGLSEEEEGEGLQHHHFGLDPFSFFLFFLNVNRPAQ